MFARQLKFLRETFFLEEKLCQSLGEVGSARSSPTLGQPTGLFPLQMPTSTQVRMLQFKAYTQYTAGYILPAGSQLHYVESFLNSKIPPRMLYLEWEILQLSKAAATCFNTKCIKSEIYCFTTCQDTLSSVSETASTRTDFGGPDGTGEETRVNDC